MNIRNPKELKTFALQRLEHAREDKRIVLIYAGLVVGLSVLTSLISYVLGLQIDQSGGLRNMGTRSILSTVQTMLPILQSLVLMCLDLGYVAAMLRIARGQYSSPNTLRLGFDRFWVLLRCELILGLFYVGICIAGIYAATMIYMLTPLSNSAMDLLIPLVSDTSVLSSGLVLDDATYAQLTAAMAPLFVIFGLIFCALAVPVSYRFRMVNYVLIDRPGLGAIAALRESRKMMRGNAVSLFKLDLHLWWYYAAMFGASVVCYGDQILPLLGIGIPVSGDAAYFIFYGLYWALLFVIYYCLRNRVEVTYALAYDAVKPQEKQDGVVLGNIFQM